MVCEQGGEELGMRGEQRSGRHSCREPLAIKLARRFLVTFVRTKVT